jgi:hypothetical protein
VFLNLRGERVSLVLGVVSIWLSENSPVLGVPDREVAIEVGIGWSFCGNYLLQVLRELPLQDSVVDLRSPFGVDALTFDNSVDNFIVNLAPGRKEENIVEILHPKHDLVWLVDHVVAPVVENVHFLVGPILHLYQELISVFHEPYMLACHLVEFTRLVRGAHFVEREGPGHRVKKPEGEGTGVNSICQGERDNRRSEPGGLVSEC